MSSSRAVTPPGSGVLRGLETRDPLAVVAEHDTLDMVELRVQSIECGVHTVESP